MFADPHRAGASDQARWPAFPSPDFIMRSRIPLSALGILVLAVGCGSDDDPMNPFATLEIGTSSLPDGTQSVPYSQGLSATGGDGANTWSLTAGALPAGLTLGAATGVIDGTPTTVGAASFTVRVESGDGQSATQPLSIDVVDDGGGGPLVTWTWVGGSSNVDQSAVFGTMGVPAAGNAPGARGDAVGWSQPNGDFWFFGGEGYGDGGEFGIYNDLWRWDGASWTWMSGSSDPGQNGVYGMKGVAAPTNVPGSRHEAASATDDNGDLWLFGGIGWAGPDNGRLNDLWRFDGSEWTWMAGGSSANSAGEYGVQGMADDQNTPGARNQPMMWADPDGGLWVFGGFGYDTFGTSQSFLNDLWYFDGAEWTWVAGSQQHDQAGVYGTKGVADPGNVPGARLDGVTWIDANGDLWLFGGTGYAEVAAGRLNDLWRFDGTNWTWMAGPKSPSAGVYGTRGVPDGANVPGARQAGVGWTDASGDLWLFGGRGYGETFNNLQLGDLWRFDGTNWTWIAGGSDGNETAVYGSQGAPAPTNMPGARADALAWIDGSGVAWLFGGGGYDASSLGRLNDLWKVE